MFPSPFQFSKWDQFIPNQIILTCIGWPYNKIWRLWCRIFVDDIDQDHNDVHWSPTNCIDTFSGFILKFMHIIFNMQYIIWPILYMSHILYDPYYMAHNIYMWIELNLKYVKNNPVSIAAFLTRIFCKSFGLGMAFFSSRTSCRGQWINFSVTWRIKNHRRKAMNAGMM